MSNRIMDLAEIATSLTGVPHSRLFSSGRLPRRVALVRFSIWLVASECGYGQEELAAIMGLRDRSTISHGIIRVRALMSSTPWLSDLVSRLRLACQLHLSLP